MMVVSSPGSSSVNHIVCMYIWHYVGVYCLQDGGDDYQILGEAFGTVGGDGE